MKQMHFQNLVKKGERVRRSKSVVLTDRDLEIIEYILDMKFASIENVFQKFFKVTLAGEEAKSNEWAVRRLQQLASSGYLFKVHSFSERESYYLATMKGYYAVRDVKPTEIVLRPNQTIDHFHFNHDKLVLEARIALENHRAVTCWLSDKKLRSARELSGGLVNSNVPDGIFTEITGRRVAIEIERTQKSKKVYLQRIRRYLLMMRSIDPKVKVFEKVYFLCVKIGSYEYLKSETKLYGELFEIHMLDSYLELVRAT